MLPELRVFWLAVLLVVARLGALAAPRLGLPAVVGELSAGVLLSGLVLLGGDRFAPPAGDPALLFLRDLAGLLLLFQIGLDTPLAKLRRVGLRALPVACLGILASLGLLLLAAALTLPGLGAHPRLFLAATLTATSIGISARVMRDLGVLHTRSAGVVLAAAVIDDILSLLLFGLLSSLLGLPGQSLGEALLGPLVFLGASLALLPRLLRRLLPPAVGSQPLAPALAGALLLAWAGSALGLAPIVGAFCAGLVLAEARPAAAARLHQRLEPLAQALVPLFFVMAGVGVDARLFADTVVLGAALGLSAAAVLGKLAAGLAAPADRLAVGWALVPRGEVALLLAAAGRQSGMLGSREFAIVALVVLLSSLAGPLGFARRLRHRAPA